MKKIFFITYLIIFRDLLLFFICSFRINIETFFIESFLKVLLYRFFNRRKLSRTMNIFSMIILLLINIFSRFYISSLNFFTFFIIFIQNSNFLCIYLMSFRIKLFLMMIKLIDFE